MVLSAKLRRGTGFGLLVPAGCEAVEDVEQAAGHRRTRAPGNRFREFASHGTITAADVRELAQFRQAAGMTNEEASEIVRRDALNLYRERFTDAKQDGHISQQEEQELLTLQRFLELPEGVVREFKMRDSNASGFSKTAVTDSFQPFRRACSSKVERFVTGTAACSHSWETPSLAVKDPLTARCVSRATE